MLLDVEQGQTLQIIGPIGEKGWWEASHLETKDNKASGDSIYVNYSTSLEAVVLSHARSVAFV